MNEDITSQLYEIDKCEVCNSEALDSVLTLGAHPLCDDLIKVGSTKDCAEYPIEILFCKECCTAHQRYQIRKKILFPDNYHYRSRQTGDVINGMKNLTADFKNKYGDLSGKKILDIGCNDGSLLDIFKAEGCKVTIGVEPTGAANDAEHKGHKIYKNYFDKAIANTIYESFGPIDLIVFTNVFAHIGTSGVELNYNARDAEGNILEKFTLMNIQLNEWRSETSSKIKKLVEKYGRIPAKAFPGRAAILLKLLKLNEDSISGIHEKPGSLKIGHYAPGTRIPILSDDDLDLDSPKPILNLAWHIPSEIKEYLTSFGYKGEIINILDPKEFVK